MGLERKVGLLREPFRLGGSGLGAGQGARQTEPPGTPGPAQQRVPTSTGHTPGTSLNNDSVLMWGLGLLLVVFFNLQTCSQLFPTQGFKQPELA